MSVRNVKRLGELLLEAGLVTPQQLVDLLEQQRKIGHRLGAIVVEEGLASQTEVDALLRQQMSQLEVQLAAEEIDPEVPKVIEESVARRHRLIPYRRENGRLLVAMVNPTDIVAIDDVRIASGMTVEPVRAAQSDVMTAIDKYYRNLNTAKAIEEFRRQQTRDATAERDVDQEALLGISNAPLVRFVDSLIRQAISLKASDIHIEPFEHRLRIRFRTDGDLREVMAPDIASHGGIVTRIKIMSDMNIGEKRLPQDGRVNYVVNGREVDMRVSIMPTAFGEKVVIRLLDRGEALMTKEQLGFTQDNLRLLDQMMRYPYGCILVAGPTGSGKTTTLYVMLEQLNDTRRNILTIEDPIEYRIEGVNQSQVHVKAGLTFASGLRSMLRQDPDIIMVGEIRDTETAQIAVRAAITGHLVLSTIHTNDAASTVTRLTDMGVEPFLISSALVGVIAQRLVRKVCPNCRRAYKANAAERRLLQVQDSREITLFRGTGCPMCGGTGYKGRTAIAEVMPFSKAIKEIVGNNQDTETIRQKALDEGMVTMQQHATRLVLEGVTSIDELARNIFTLDQE